MRTAKRIDELPAYLFASLDRKIEDAKKRGIDVISLAIGDPDLQTPSHIVEAAVEGLRDAATHRYPSYYGMAEFRQAIAAHYRRRFDITLDPDTQVLPLIGSKEGIAHLPIAFVDAGDGVLLSDPGYPVYEAAGMLMGGRTISVPLDPKAGWAPNLAEVSEEDAASSKILWLNYPNNPTSATCDLALLQEAVDFAKKHDLLFAHDAAYVEITYDGYKAPSALQAQGAFDVAVEFGSLSKTYNMTGWRIGWAVGAVEAIEALGRVKTNIDSGIFNALQRAGIAALEGPQEPVAETIEIYRKRRDRVVDVLNTSGWSIAAPKGSIYVWVSVPDGDTSATFAEFLLEKAGVVIAPGAGYGKGGEGFVRFSLTIADDRLDEALERIARALKER